MGTGSTASRWHDRGVQDGEDVVISDCQVPKAPMACRKDVVITAQEAHCEGRHLPSCWPSNP